MNIRDIERYTIPLTRADSPTFEESGITVDQLIRALSLLPREANVTTDYGGPNLFATHYKPDIDSEVDPILEALRKATGPSPR